MEAFVKKLQEDFAADYEVHVKQVNRNNGTGYTALCLRTPGSLISPVICLEKYYQKYLSGMSLPEIEGRIREEVGEYKVKVPFDPAILFDYEQVRDRIRIRVINKEWNAGILKSRAHRELCDLAIVYAVDLSDHLTETKEGWPIVHVTDRELEIWGVTEEEVYLAAMDNMKKYGNFQLIRMGDLLKDILDNGAVPDASPLAVLPDQKSEYPGPAALADQSLLLGFKEKLGGSFYVLPSSVYEVILLPAESRFDVDSLNEIVRNTNEAIVSRDEQLSDHIYFFDAETDQIRSL